MKINKRCFKYFVCIPLFGIFLVGCEKNQLESSNQTPSLTYVAHLGDKVENNLGEYYLVNSVSFEKSTLTIIGDFNFRFNVNYPIYATVTNTVYDEKGNQLNNSFFPVFDNNFNTHDSTTSLVGTNPTISYPIDELIASNIDWGRDVIFELQFYIVKTGTTSNSRLHLLSSNFENGFNR